MIQPMKIGCVADDFTGASDAASFLVTGGLETVLYNGVPRGLDDPQAMRAAVIALKTRTQETASAVSDSMEAIDWLMDKGCRTVYIKYCSTFDSTPTGNIGPICDAAMEMLNTPYTLLCPSLPVNKRTVEDGRLYVGGIPLEQTHMSKHPLTPMWDSCIPALMKDQSKYPCYILRRETMRQGREAVLSEIKPYTVDNRHFYLIPDYVTGEDARLIVSIFGDIPLLTGGSGLMDELAKQHAAEDSVINSTNSRVNGNALILSGSCSVATQAQVRHFLDGGGLGIMLDPAKLMSGEQTPEEAWKQVEALGQSEAVIYSSGSGGKKQEGRDSQKAAELLEAAMARIAKLAVDDGIARIIVAGGETSGAVTKALGLSSYQIGESIAPGVPVMMPLQNKRIRLVLKSGNFGQEDFFRRALDITGGPDNE